MSLLFVEEAYLKEADSQVNAFVNDTSLFDGKLVLSNKDAAEVINSGGALLNTAGKATNLIINPDLLSVGFWVELTDRYINSVFTDKTAQYFYNFLSSIMRPDLPPTVDQVIAVAKALNYDFRLPKTGVICVLGHEDVTSVKFGDKYYPKLHKSLVVSSAGSRFNFVCSNNGRHLDGFGEYLPHSEVLRRAMSAPFDYSVSLELLSSGNAFSTRPSLAIEVPKLPPVDFVGEFSFNSTLKFLKSVCSKLGITNYEGIPYYRFTKEDCLRALDTVTNKYSNIVIFVEKEIYSYDTLGPPSEEDCLLMAAYMSAFRCGNTLVAVPGAQVNSASIPSGTVVCKAYKLPSEPLLGRA